MGRWKTYPDLDKRVLELLAQGGEGKRFNEIFDGLKPGSRSTLSDCLKSLVAASFIEHHYLTGAFMITDHGRAVLGRSEIGQREMEFLLDSSIFKDKHEAVRAAIEYWFGLTKSRLETQLLSFLPIRIDKDGRLLGIPETESEWQTLEKVSGKVQKVQHDVENELIQRLHVFVRRHRAAAALALRRSETEPKDVTKRAWPVDATNDLILAFGSDKGLAETCIKALRSFLKKTYPESVDQKALTQINHRDFQDFVKRKYPHVPLQQLAARGSKG